MVTIPSFAVPDESVYEGVPNEYPVGGGDGSVGSVIVPSRRKSGSRRRHRAAGDTVLVTVPERAAVVVDRERTGVTGRSAGQRLHELQRTCVARQRVVRRHRHGRRSDDRDDAVVRRVRRVVYVGVPNEYPVGGGDGSAGSVIVHTVPVGIPLIVAEPPAGTYRSPLPNAPQL